MPKQIVSDEDFIEAWNELGSATLVSRKLGLTERTVMHRRSLLESKLNISLHAHNDQRFNRHIMHSENKIRSIADVTGSVVVFSDAHFMPNETSTAFNALIKVIKKVRPQIVIANGDILDGGQISKYGPEGWQAKPTLKQELESVQWHMDQIVKACKGLGTILHRTIGNHDIRFDKRLAGVVPEYRDVSGTKLSDHIPEWTVSWSVMVNNNTMIKHRMQHSGIHSGYNNVLKSGINSVTGHTHLLEVRPWGDYRGRRYGVSTGMLADPKSQAFDYTEDNPLPWCSGFVILPYHNDGQLLPPELCEVVNGTAFFRGSEV